MQIVETTAKGRIRALMASTKKTIEVARAATKAARQEERRRLDERRKREEEQARVEQRMDDFLARARKGLENILELSRHKDLHALATARASIGGQTPLYSEGEERHAVDVLLTAKGVGLLIHAIVPSSVQGVDKPTHFESCKVGRHVSYLGKDMPSQKWLAALFFADFHTEWDESDFEEKHVHDRPRVDAMSLGRLERLNLAEIAEKRDEFDWDWDVHLGQVLLKFLADCSDPEILKRYLEQALADMA